MWILEIVGKTGKRQRFHLVFGGDYTIGRKGCDILIDDPDISISRAHAKLTVLSVPAGSLADIAYVPELYVADTSKHGTFVNEGQLLSIEASRRIGPKDRLRFGKYVVAAVFYSPIVVSMSPSLRPDQQRAVVNATGKIGGILTDPLLPSQLYDAHISPFMFVFATNEVSGEVSALRAMMCGYVLVSADYVPDLFVVMRDSCRLPLLSLPQPGNFDAMRSPLLADRPYHRPEPAVYVDREFLFSPPKAPHSIFRMMNVVFLDEHLHQQYEDVIDIGGGSSCFVQPEMVLNWEPSDADLPLLGLIDVTKSHGLNSIFLVEKNEFQTILEVLVGHAAAIDPERVTPSIRALVKLWDLGFKLMHEENLHVAVYCADTAAQIADNAPGILLKDAMRDIAAAATMGGGGSGADDVDSDGYDSDATEDGYAGRVAAGPSSSAHSQHQQQQHGGVKLYLPQQLCPSPNSKSSAAGGEGSGKRSATGPAVAAVNVYEQFRATLLERKEAEMGDAANAAASSSTPRRRAGSPAARRRGASPAATSTTTAIAAAAPFVAPIRLTKSPVRTLKSPHTFGDTTPEERLVSLCRDFAAQTLKVVAARVEQECRSSIRQQFMPAPTKQFLEATAIRVQNFLGNLAVHEAALDGRRISASSQRVVDEVRDRSTTLFGAINATAQALAVAMNFTEPRRSSS